MKRILIANPYGIGDVLCTLPLIEALHRSNPDAVLGFLCNRRTESIVRLFPGIRECTVFEKDEFRDAWKRSKKSWWSLVRRLIQELTNQRWEVVFDLSLNGQFSLAWMLLGIPRRIGFDYRRRGRFLTDRVALTGFKNRHVSDYYLDLLSSVDLSRPTNSFIRLSVPEVVIGNSREVLRKSGVCLGSEKLIAVVPGGGASWGPNAHYKQWPSNHFTDLVRQLKASGDYQIILLGDQTDQLLCEEIHRSCPEAIVVPPAAELSGLAGILSQCDLVVGNDSGALHLAVAVGVRSISIFGPANPVVYGPTPGAGQRHRIVVKPLACRPCYEQFRLPPCPWENRCLKQLEPIDVYKTAQELLAA